MGYEFLVETAVKGVIVLALGCVAAGCLRRARAAVRAQVWAAVFVALLALPALAKIVPALRLPVAAAWTVPDTVVRTTATGTAGAPTADLPAQTQRSQTSRVALDWMSAIAGIWLVGATVLLSMSALGWAAASRMRRRAIPFPDASRDVDVRLTDSAAAPMQVGILRPTILLPLAARTWAAERLELVLRHERAHIEAHDLAIQFGARLVLALHWWNPLAWFAWRQLLRDRERAADDAVLRGGVPASEYAAHLLEIVREVRAASPLAVAAMAQETDMEHRFTAILDRTADRRAATGRHAAAAAIATLCLLVPLAATRAQAPNKDFQKADAALARRDFDAARAAVNEDIAAMNTRSGPAYARALVKAADIERRRANRGGAADLYKQALAAAGDAPETAPALMALGQWALADQHYADATQLFERAERVSAASPARAVVWQALARERQGDAEGAGVLYNRALALAAPRSADRVAVVNLYRRFLNANGKTAEADSLTIPLGPDPQPKEGVFRMGSGIQAPKLLSKEEPAYTDEARIAKLDGAVVLSVEVSPDGLPRNIQVVKALGLGLEDNAVDAVSRWRFEPGRKDGQPVVVSAHIEVNFRLL